MTAPTTPCTSFLPAKPWKLREIVTQAALRYDADWVYFEPSILSLKVRENVDHLKVNKEKEIKGREILDDINFNNEFS